MTALRETREEAGFGEDDLELKKFEKTITVKNLKPKNVFKKNCFSTT